MDYNSITTVCRYGLIAVIFAVGCKGPAAGDNGQIDPPAKVKEPVAASYNGGQITLAELDKELKIKHKSSVKTARSQVTQKVLADMLEERLLREEVRRKGIDRRPDIEERVNNYRFRLAREILENEQLSAKRKISIEEANKYYNEHLSDFEEVRLRDILIKVNPGDSKEEKMRKIELARQIHERAKAGEDFAGLAIRFSDDIRTKDRGGDTGFISIKKSPESTAIRKAVAQLTSPGQISPVVPDIKGFHILYLEGRRTVSFERVRSKIDAILIFEKGKTARREWIESLKKTYGVQIFDDVIQPSPSHR